MKTKEDILTEVTAEIRARDHEDVSALWIQCRLIEVLIDIRDVLVTDCKDAMNALIEIRRIKDNEREI